MNKKLKVGQTVFVKKQREALDETKVVKVGNKFFYLDGWKYDGTNSHLTPFIREKTNNELQIEREKVMLIEKARIYLTLCYYEAPAAKAHIDFWEAAMKDKILKKVEDPKTLFYIVKKYNGDQEVVYCIKMNDIPKMSVLFKDTLGIEAETKSKIRFLKMLVFGKVTEDDLLKIMQFTNSVEDFFNVRKNVAESVNENFVS